jgi:hypothetical protein
MFASADLVNGKLMNEYLMRNMRMSVLAKKVSQPMQQQTELVLLPIHPCGVLWLCSGRVPRGLPFAHRLVQLRVPHAQPEPHFRPAGAGSLHPARSGSVHLSFCASVPSQLIKLLWTYVFE